MNRARNKLLAGSRFSGNHNGTFAESHLGQDRQNLPHAMVFGDDIRERIRSRQLLSKRFHRRKVTECFRAPYYPAR